MTLGNFRISLAMGRRDAECSCAEFFFYRCVCHYLEVHGHTAEDDVILFTDKFLVALVVGMHCHCRVADLSFKTRGCDGNGEVF